MIGLFLAPLQGVLKVVELIHERVQEELENEDVLRRRLVELRLKLEMGELEPEAFAEAEADLIARLRRARLARLEGGRP